MWLFNRRNKKGKRAIDNELSQFQNRQDANDGMNRFWDNGTGLQPIQMESMEDGSEPENGGKDFVAPGKSGGGKNSDTGQRVPLDKCPISQTSPCQCLESGHKAVLEQIQLLVGIARRLEDNPQNEELRGRLVSGVLAFSGILEAEGLEVMVHDSNPAAFIPVVDDVKRPSSLVVRPAILRDGRLILKGIRCLPKADSVDGAPGETGKEII